MDVKFLRGLSTAYQNIASKDSKTFYFTTDDNKLYLGDVLLSNEITLVAFNELEERVKALEDAGFQAQIDAINETLKSIATSDTVEAIDNRLKAVEADYLKGADKIELEGKITAHETAVNTKFNDYRTSAAQDEIDNAQTKALNDYKAEMVETLKGYQTTIPAETYDAYGSAAAAETAAKGYADKKLEDFEKAYITEDGGAIDKLNEIAGWIADDKSGAVKIISDVATNAADIKNIKESAPMTSGITAAKVADIAKGVEAQGWGNHATQGYLKAADIEDKEDKSNLKALAYKDIAEKSDLAADVQASLGKADTALQAHQDISHLATKQEVTDGLALKVDNTTYNAYIEAHKDDYNNAKVDELVAAAAKAGTDAAAAADAKAVAAQGEVDALEGVVAANAQTCQNNFNTISEQLTWGSF